MTENAATCVMCPKPAELGRAVCSEEHAEEWRRWVSSLPAGCERDGECVLPFRHDGGCDWGE